LHFPAILPTYAKFNHVFKNYIENTHGRVLRVIRSEELFNMLDPQKEGKYFNGEIKWLVEEVIEMQDVFGMSSKNQTKILAMFDKFFANQS
jgi:transposase